METANMPPLVFTAIIVPKAKIVPISSKTNANLGLVCHLILGAVELYSWPRF